MALEEPAICPSQGMIPHSITHHTSVDSVKPLSHGSYADHGNWSGSLVMLMLLFPEEYGLTTDPNGFKLMSCLNGAGDREQVLHSCAT